MDRKKAFIISAIVSLVTLFIVAWPIYLATPLGMSESIYIALVTALFMYMISFNIIAHTKVYDYLVARKEVFLERIDDIKEGFEDFDILASILVTIFYILYYIVIIPFIAFVVVFGSVIFFIPGIAKFREDENNSYYDED